MTGPTTAHTPGRSLRPARTARHPRTPHPSTHLDVDALLDDPATRVVVCCGSGGVGKTTTAAALALRAAERGRSVAVLTIDPARRLAQALGLAELDNTPRTVAGVDTSAGGRLDAMMLDMKRTFDEIVQAHATPAKAEQILANPFYQALSSSFAGTQEYMAMEKLGQLHELTDASGAPRWDLVVVDTPPSRSALDFLDAPARLGSFLDGRFVRLLTAPAKVGGRAYLKVVSGGIGLASSMLTKVLGTALLTDVQTLVAALDTTFGGFRERADRTYALLQRGGTAFLVVAAPERDPLREAGYFVDRLRADDMPLAGVVVNRVVRSLAPEVEAPTAAAAVGHLEDADEDPHTDAVVAGLLRLQARTVATADRHAQITERFADRHPQVPVASVGLTARDVHDLEGLRGIGADLAAAGTAPGGRRATG
ncbi:ArsA family ATPase [Agilicoccus flavus]|uniref:ArsA family ATPase n=1 Tax=Agilicoccus flavus TaxID=2775968 RepID=UPI001CF6717D|nr:ArsA-related P-loop ATPase [Agilicoccus flavus]